MQATPRRNPKGFAQRTMAAAIAASAIAAFGFEASAQTTGGGIGANVNSNPGGAARLPTQGTTGTAGGTSTSGVAAPNAPANPATPGTGPGINNTGSPALATPRNLQGPVGGGGGRTPAGTSRIPGNAVPVNPRLNPRATTGLNGATVPQPTTAPVAPVGGTGATTAVPVVPNDTLKGTIGTQRPAAGLRTGTITDFTDTSLTFREGANTTTLTITGDTVVQMDGRNITLRDIPANAQVRLERNPRFANVVQRIVVVPQAAATGGTSVNMQTGTGSTGSANRSLRTTGSNDTGFSSGGTAVNSQTGTGSASASTSATTATQPAPTPANVGDFGGATSATTIGAASGSTPNRVNAGDFGGASGTTGANISQNAATTNTAQPRANLGDFGGATVGAAATNQNQTQAQNATTDSSQFLGPVSGTGTAKPGSATPAPGATAAEIGATSNGRSSADIVTPTIPTPSTQNPPQRGRVAQPWTTALGSRFGMQMNDTRQGLTLGNVTNQSLAARSGLRAGDRIQSINGTNVATAADFGQALQAAAQSQTPITASVLRNGAPQSVSLALPNGFFNGINMPAPAVAAPGVNSIGTAVTGAGSLAVTPDGSVGVNAGGVFVPGEGQAQVGAAGVAGAAAGTTVAPAAQATTQEQQEQTVTQTQLPAPTRVRPVDVPVATQRQGVTTEALKIPDINLGWTLKPTPEGVVMSSIVEDGLAAKNKFESGDIIESIDGRPITAPGAVSYELHRHRAGAAVKFGILRKGHRIEEDVTLPEDHKPLLLNRNETFGQANNDAKEQGGSGAKPVPVKPTDESIRTLESENRALRKQLDEVKPKK